ncbi:MAG: RsmD family RNA methyltransferase [Flavobacteriales bacterium]|nr:Ribosomal RNA small subunit methyltransferase D [Flavobacteriales bacterium]MCC6576260.1 RsmD family RNA methyltransferase [Flavobacteriales bacterium]NUQ15536.1 RsmD family RNA methyltransferase [Flavobacteriales bacterium]
MRIIGGRHRNRRIDPPKGIEARPTTDFAREGLFNILRHSTALEGIRVLDLFAGAGGISAEFVSHGATQVISVEQDARLFAHLQRLARTLDEPGWSQVRADVFQYLRHATGPFDIVFADPPFHLPGTETLPALVREAGLLLPDGLFILEHPRGIDPAADPWFRRERTYGAVHFSFFSPTPS